MNQDFLDESAAFEKQGIVKDLRKGFNLLLIYALFDLFIRLIYFVISIYVDSQKSRPSIVEFYKKLEVVYDLVAWGSILGHLTILIIAIIKIRKTSARAILIIIAVLQTLFFAYFQFK